MIGSTSVSSSNIISTHHPLHGLPLNEWKAQNLAKYAQIKAEKKQQRERKKQEKEKQKQAQAQNKEKANKEDEDEKEEDGTESQDVTLPLAAKAAPKRKAKKPIWGGSKRKKVKRGDTGPKGVPADDDPPIVLIPLTHDPAPYLTLEGGGRPKYSIAYTPSNKSHCSGCKATIAMGDIRATISLYGNHPFKYNFHIPCLHASSEYHFPSHLVSNPENITGWDTLREVDQAAVKVCLEATQWD